MNSTYLSAKLNEIVSILRRGLSDRSEFGHMNLLVLLSFLKCKQGYYLISIVNFERMTKTTERMTRTQNWMIIYNKKNVLI